ncbi:hypothetical protein FGO68_gene15026 [Halteria grandinella]|uniref:Uncharacterized protein n=1 Tax=Halteria grandinella TaxID=5974 RepID=A0A8J8SUQ8_HALGN|nr:hypothetical protein FGO68_gene15026 [Halteria grandinella]
MSGKDFVLGKVFQLYRVCGFDRYDRLLSRVSECTIMHQSTRIRLLVDSLHVGHESGYAFRNDRSPASSACGG